MFTSHQYWEQTVGHYPVIIEKQHPPHWPLQPRSSLFVISLFTWLAILLGFRLPDILLELESCFYFLITGALTAQSADVGICRARPQIILQEIKKLPLAELCRELLCLLSGEERGERLDLWLLNQSFRLIRVSSDGSAVRDSPAGYEPLHPLWCFWPGLPIVTTLSILSEHIPTQSNTLPGDDLVHNASINTNQILSDQQRVRHNKTRQTYSCEWQEFSDWFESLYIYKPSHCITVVSSRYFLSCFRD